MSSDSTTTAQPSPATSAANPQAQTVGERLPVMITATRITKDEVDAFAFNFTNTNMPSANEGQKKKQTAIIYKALLEFLAAIDNKQQVVTIDDIVSRMAHATPVQTRSEPTISSDLNNKIETVVNHIEKREEEWTEVRSKKEESKRRREEKKKAKAAREAEQSARLQQGLSKFTEEQTNAYRRKLEAKGKTYFTPEQRAQHQLETKKVSKEESLRKFKAELKNSGKQYYSYAERQAYKAARAAKPKGIAVSVNVNGPKGPKTYTVSAPAVPTEDQKIKGRAYIGRVVAVIQNLPQEALSNEKKIDFLESVQTVLLRYS